MKVGYSRLEITPPLGITINGFWEPRYADGILDPLYATAVAFSDGEKTAVVVSLDILELIQSDTDPLRARIGEKFGIDPDAVLLHCTHTHTGPVVSKILFEPDPNYVDFLYKRITDAVGFAIADLKEAKAFIGRAEAKNVAHIRRYIMADGTLKTHPRPGDPDIREKQGLEDEEVQLIRITREGGHDVAIVNFQCHLNSIGGNKISADLTHYVRLALEGALADVADGKGVKVAYFSGAQGDTCCVDLKNPKYGKYILIQNVGRTVAAAALTAYTYAEEVNFEGIGYKQVEAEVPEYGEDEEAYNIHMTAIRIGDVGFIGYPGEPYTEIGRRVKQGSAYKMTINTCMTNGWISYIPTREAIPYGSMGVNPKRNPDVEDICVNTAIELSKETSK